MHPHVLEFDLILKPQLIIDNDVIRSKNAFESGTYDISLTVSWSTFSHFHRTISLMLDTSTLLRATSDYQTRDQAHYNIDITLLRSLLKSTLLDRFN